MRKFGVITTLAAALAIGSAAAAEPAVERTDVFVGGVDGYHTYRIPALVVTDQGTLLAFCEGRKTGSGDAGDIDLLLKRSLDGGRTWSKQTTVHEEGGNAPITIGNPCPIVDGDAVRLLFTRNNKRLFYTESLDEGLTWSGPIEHTGILKGFDFPVVRLGTGPVHGLRARSGKLIAPVWLCSGEVRDKSRRYRSGILISEDGGRSWRAGGLVPSEIEGLNECTLLEREDGSLLLNMRAQGGAFRAVSESADGGRTWSAPVLDAAIPCPTCQGSLLGLSGRDALFANPAGPGRRNLTVRFSPDGGRTWTGSRVLDTRASAYSDLALAHDGTVLCLYECGENRYSERIVIARFDRDWLFP